ncbi:hypothetical protein DL770_005677 [Monosporascus sp. CRB-9-2]|nr:hypothetical protein DL770_005677 [Monosporascus sp. CRB-9-2]
MRILESQNAVLTNLEVHEFLSAQAKEYQEQKRRGPGNLETLRKEKPPPFDAAAIPALLQRLRVYQISKGEFIMIFNMRPTNIPTLNAVIEDMEERFTQDEQEDIVNGIAEVLGSFPPPPEEDGEGDAMQTTE